MEHSVHGTADSHRNTMRAPTRCLALTLLTLLLAGPQAAAQAPPPGDPFDAVLRGSGSQSARYTKLLALADRAWRQDPERFEREVLPRLREETEARFFETARVVEVGPGGLSLAGAPPWLELVRHVQFTDVALDESVMLALASSPHASKVRWFMLERVTKCDEGLATLVGVADSLPNLEMIWTMGGDCGDPGAQALARSPLLGRLTQLYIQRSRLSPTGARALAASAHLSNLTSLGVKGSGGLGDDGVAALAASPHLSGLRVLDLRGVGMTARGARAVAAAAGLGRVRQLLLGQNDLGDAGVSALAQAAGFGGLEDLGLADVGVGEAGARALARAAHLSRLRTLTIRSNPALGQGAAALVGSTALGGLRELRAEHCGLGDDVAEAIARSPGLARLERLHLYGNRIGPGGAEALAYSPRARDLKRVTLCQNPIGEVGEGFLNDPKAPIHAAINRCRYAPAR
jgi:hypothetical protein